LLLTGVAGADGVVGSCRRTLGCGGGVHVKSSLSSPAFLASSAASLAAKSMVT
jgi:hypothetical protein